MSAKATISSKLEIISAFRIPRIAPLRKIFSRPVSSGRKPVPTSSRLAIRARTTTHPSVGSVIREMIFSKVLLPAPLRPMIPITSPWATSKLTSFSAQKCSRVSSEELKRSPEGESGDANLRDNILRRLRPRNDSCWSIYRLDKRSMWRIGSMSNDVGEPSLHPSEDQQANHKDHKTHSK